MEHAPVEIFERVFRSLAGDQDALASCTLVCRSWTATVYPLRFKTLKYTAYINGSPNEASVHDHTFEAFVNFLSTAYLRSYVQHLHLTATISSYINDEGRTQFTEVPLELGQLQMILSLMPHISSLVVACPVAHTPGKPLSSQTLVHLRQLVIPGPISTSHLALILSLFQSIENFSMVSVLFEDVMPFQYSRPAIRHFTSPVCWAGAAAALKNLHILDENSPRSLTVSCAGPQSEYKDLIRAFGHVLRELYVDDIGDNRSVVYGPEHAKFDDAISACPNLCVLHLSGLLPIYNITSSGVPNPQDLTDEWSSVVQAIEAASPTLTELHVTFRLCMRGNWRPPLVEEQHLPYEAVRQLGDLDWEALASAATSHHPSLRSAYINIIGIGRFALGARKDFPDIKRAFFASRCFKGPWMDQKLRVALVEPSA